MPDHATGTPADPFPAARRDALRQLRSLAEPGEWVPVQDTHGENQLAVAGFERTRTIAHVCASGPDYGRGNAFYLAAAASSMMDVLDALDAVEAERDELRARLAAIRVAE
ncbi:hypothetical protein ACT17_32765 [Mycolicibacterium conceptionense]|uniref:Uncharacterized protein n=1 Tax=Mycolicibacterium conceptionense TaxID=451644 RepID=A0A0J8U098_9MYCO|nr:hypothetical protein [Mycolicibacterium conceptionense]KMV13955.1 hypothetical protein ACT17_32765 [Mycolicibacterium conceptionense]